MEIWAVKDVKDLILSRLTLSCTSYRLFRSFPKAAHTSLRSETNRYVEQIHTADVRHLSHLLFCCPLAPATFILIYFFYPTETNLLPIVLDSLPDLILPSLLNTLQTKNTVSTGIERTHSFHQAFQAWILQHDGIEHLLCFFTHIQQDCVASKLKLINKKNQASEQSTFTTAAKTNLEIKFTEKHFFGQFGGVMSLQVCCISNVWTHALNSM